MATFLSRAARITGDYLKKDWPGAVIAA